MQTHCPRIPSSLTDYGSLFFLTISLCSASFTVLLVCTCTVYYVQCIMCNVLCAMNYVQCIMCNVFCTMYTVFCILYFVQCIMYYVLCTRYQIHMILTLSPLRHLPESRQRVHLLPSSQPPPRSRRTLHRSRPLRPRRRRSHCRMHPQTRL